MEEGVWSPTSVDHDSQVRVGVSDSGGDGVRCMKVSAARGVGFAHVRNIRRALERNDRPVRAAVGTVRTGWLGGRQMCTAGRHCEGWVAGR